MAQSGTALIPGSPGRIGCYGPGGNLPVDSVTHVDFFAHRETVDSPRALSDKPQPLRRVDPASVLRLQPAPRRSSGLRSPRAPGAPSVQPPSRPRTGRETRHTPEAHSAAFENHCGQRQSRFEKEPSLLGHYRASRLTGAEDAIDRLIGCSISRSLALGLYPRARHPADFPKHTDQP